MFDWLKSWFGLRPLSDDEFERKRNELVKKIPIPVFWLFGKTGSGKSSIVRFLTGSTQAEIGNGFQPKTRTSFEFDFPNSQQPLVRFLDTRGLGEIGYDPAEDLRAFDQSTHVVLVVVRVMDHALDEVVAGLTLIRAQRPARPVILVLTCLHEAYPFEQHPNPDPFPLTPLAGDNTVSNPSPEESFGTTAESATRLPSASASNPTLARNLREQELRFQGLVDKIIPIDLTPEIEGFEQPNFGGRRLEESLIESLPAACRQALLHFDELRASLKNLNEHKALPTILTYSSLAATAAAAPLPWVDIPIVMGLQTRLVYLLAELYDQNMNASLLLQLAGAVGGRLALRFAIKAPLKLIPIVGQTANAAMAFAYTFSLGKACCWYFSEMKGGHVPSPADLEKVWAEQLQQAVAVWRTYQK